jgi:probable DNA metabolism protein
VIGYCASHFRYRLANRHWILHDVGRNIALYWDTNEIQTVEIDADLTQYVARFGELPEEKLTEEEHYFQKLWKSFHTTIANPDRENKLLQLRFMPRRYWRYLVESR